MTKTNITFHKNVLPWIMFSIAASFYCYAYFLRITPSMMQDQLIKHFSISATQFGMIGAFYYFAYTPLQIPVGVIVDSFGARRVLVSASLLCSFGVTLFISADTLPLACLGRFIMGFGSAFGYITVLKIAALWLPTNRFATAAGLATAFGMLAAVFADNYLAEFVQLVGYDDALYSSLGAGIVLAFIMFLFLRNRPHPKHAHNEPPERMTFKELFTELGTIALRPQTWYIGLVGCLLYLPASVFLDLWAPGYFETVHHLDPKTTAHVISMTFFGWIIGGPAIGWLSDHICLRRTPLLVASVIATITISLIFYIPHPSVTTLYILMFILGIVCGSHPLVFSLSRENSSNKLSATATATTNFLIMMGGVIFQPVVGMLLTWHSGVTATNGATQFSPADYNFALSIIPIGLITALFITLLIKETHCHLPPD